VRTSSLETGWHAGDAAIRSSVSYPASAMCELELEEDQMRRETCGSSTCDAIKALASILSAT
jgi:hypothetical protein